MTSCIGVPDFDGQDHGVDDSLKALLQFRLSLFDELVGSRILQSLCRQSGDRLEKRQIIVLEGLPPEFFPQGDETEEFLPHNQGDPYIQRDSGLFPLQFFQEIRQGCFLRR